MPPLSTDARPELRRRLGSWAFFGAFLIAAVLVGLLAGRSQSSQLLKLEDGRILKMEAVTYGSNHVAHTGATWRHSWQKRIPVGFRGLLGPEVDRIEVPTIGSTLFAWISIDSSKQPKPPKWTDVNLISDAGQSFPSRGHQVVNNFNGRMVGLLRFDHFPRRDGSFIVTGKVDQLPFSFRLQNPVVGNPIPTWTAGDMPATNHVDGYDIVLSKAVAYQFPENPQPALTPYLRVLQQGKLVSAAFQHETILADPTGNRTTDFLSTNEPVWRIGAIFWRNHTADWQTNEYRDFAITNLPAAATHQIVEIHDVIQGCLIKQAWIGGPGRYRFNADRLLSATQLAAGDPGEIDYNNRAGGGWKLNWARPQPWLLIVNDKPAEKMGQRLSIFLLDANGNPLNLNPEFKAHGGVSYRQWFTLKPGWKQILEAKDPKAGIADLHPPPYTLRIAVQTNLVTEFFINPDDLIYEHR